MRGQGLVHAWYRKAKWLYLLLPCSWIFSGIAALRRRCHQKKAKKINYPVPIIVIGNLTIGGSGKTPLLITLVKHLQQQGYQPAVISRGYGAHPSAFPHVVLPDQDSQQTGDEPLLIARATQVPVVIDPQRTRAIEYILKNVKANVILSDDGLQHYKMPRDIEIVVVDGQRRFGNGLCLPAGPLREPVSRLKTVDFVVNNGGTPEAGEYAMTLQPISFIAVQDSTKKVPLNAFENQTVHAVAGIGNPVRFFNQLRQLNLTVIEHAFPDHHAFVDGDLSFGDTLPIIMTEKDAVKCKRFAQTHWWCLPVEAKLDERLLKEILTWIKNYSKS